jgi:RNA polymerase sigma factor (sigma-70 family)
MEGEGTLVNDPPWRRDAAQPGNAGSLWEEFAPVYADTFPVVVAYILARVYDRDLAEDLTAETFERGLRGWHGFRRRSSPRTWLLGIARHVVADHLRRVGREGQRQGPDALAGLADGASVEGLVQTREDARVVLAALRHLSATDQDLLILRYGSDLSFPEIARITGLRAGTARVRVHRALARLRRLLTEGDEI